jgi:hypothetical protein
MSLQKTGAARMHAVEYIVRHYALNVRRACRLIKRT